MKFFAALSIFAIYVFTNLSNAQAQTDRWFSGASEFLSNSAWVNAPSNSGLAKLELFCQGGVVMISFGESRVHSEQQGNVDFDVDGKKFRQPGGYDDSGADPAWIVLGPVDLVEALKSGTSVRVTAPAVGTSVFSLRGSSAAIAKGTAGCTALPAMQQAAEQVPNALTPEWVAAKAQQECGGQAEFASDAIKQGEFDGDNVADYALDWGKITCTDAATVGMTRGAGRCGAQSCTVDIYASSVFDPNGWPQPIIANKITPTKPGSEIKLRTEYAGGSCPVGQVCRADWVWNGKKLVVKR